MKRLLSCCLLTVLALTMSRLRLNAKFRNSAAPEATIYVGILDDAREDLMNWKPGVAEQRIIMPAFERHESGWQSIKSFSPQKMKWTIAFDGKNLGQVESYTNAEGNQLNSEFSRAKQTILTRTSEIPSVGAPSTKFAGVFAPGPEKFRRPLVAVSKPNFRDPDNWKRANLPTSVLQLVRKGFRREYPHVGRCVDEELAEKDWNYSDSAIKLVTTYASNKESFLVAVHLNAGDCGWGGYPDDPLDTFVDQWFLVTRDKAVWRVGGFAELLDAGDYDNDGHSELIFFSMRSEVSDAYDLVYGDFRHKAELVIGYN